MNISLRLSRSRLILLAAVFLVLTGNAAFFSKLSDVYSMGPSDALFVISVGIVHFCVLLLIITTLSVVLPTRLIVSAFLLLGAAVGYFADHYGTVIDTGMIGNFLETDAAETRDLLSAGFLLRMLALGIIPVVLIWQLELTHATRWREWRYRLQTAAVSVALITACIFSASEQYASFFRIHKPLRYYANPTFAVYSAGKYVADALATPESGQIATIVPDAEVIADHGDHELIIMVVGETARADRFSLNGYSRTTNPELAKIKDLVSYTNMAACGTSTAVSVPCMFALAGRDEFNIRDAKHTENVLDVLHRAGINILWRDNNSGSKGVAARVTSEDFTSPALNPVCDTECRDEGMLHGLQDYVDEHSGDILIVLHQMGNHGPAYFKRYPAQFERFTPACRSEELSRCTDEEIGNAYDNAILYTDHFLSQVIAFLQSNTPKYETAMIYISDHGESLGENGLYLHGSPYFLAPSAQTNVPAIVWTGASSDIDLASALELQHLDNSHDAIFGSLLAAFEIKTGFVTPLSTLFDMKADNAL